MAKKETAMSSFESMITRDLGDMKEPKDTIPSGEWVLRCQSAKLTENEEYDPSDNTKDYQGIVQISHVPVEAKANVDEDSLEDGDWRGVPIFTRLYLRTDRDVYDVRGIILGHGISMEGRGLQDGIDLIKTRQTVASVGLKTFKRRDGSSGKSNTLTNFRAVD